MTANFSAAVIPVAFAIFILRGWLPTVACNCTTIYLTGAAVRREYSRICEVSSKVEKLLDYLPLQRNGYKNALLSEQGRCKLLMGDFEGAELAYIAILDRKSNFIPPAQQQSKSTRRAAQQVLPALATLYVGLACLLQRKFEKADEYFMQSRKILESNPTLYTTYGGLVELWTGAMYLELNDLNSAEIPLLLSEKYFANPPKVAWQSELQQAAAISELLLALYYIKKDMLSDADNRVTRSYSFYENNYTSPIAINWFNQIAGEYIGRKNFKEAEKVLEMAYKVGLHVPTHPNCGHTHQQFERLLIETNRESEISDMKKWIRPLTTGQ